jgi:hypothetical protein
MFQIYSLNFVGKFCVTKCSCVCDQSENFNKHLSLYGEASKNYKLIIIQLMGSVAVHSVPATDSDFDK